jgi:hypothetical protein
MPANYPGADPSFSNKSAGQQIQSAHMNAVQDEVVAIGAALRGTLQHSVTTANSIVGSSNLSIGGNSTLTGALNAGASTVASLTVSGNLNVVGSVTSTLTLSNVLRVPYASTTLSGGSTRFDNVVLPSTGVMIRIDSNSTAAAVSGFSTPVPDGRVVYVVNANAAVSLTLLNEDANSSATCRIQLGGANRAIVAGGMTTIVYDAVTGRWRG